MMTSTPEAKAAEAGALCSNMACPHPGTTRIQITGFPGAVDGKQWLPFCGECFATLQAAWLLGTASTEVAIMLGVDLSPRREDRE